MSDSPQPPTGELKNLSLDGDKVENERPSTPSSVTFTEQFKTFAKFGDPKSDGKQITLSNSDKWMKQAKVIDGKKITTTDTGIAFKKLKSTKVGILDYQKFLEDLAKSKKIEVAEIKSKLTNCGQARPSWIGGKQIILFRRNYISELIVLLKPLVNVKNTSTVDRLTDASKFTGTHKQRFDETGKGKGIAGRKDLVDASGYVSGYQNKDSYEKKE